MKRALRISKSIFFRFAWLCIISFCFLVVNISVSTAKQEDPGSYPILASNEETINPSTTETKNKTVQNQAWEPPLPLPDEFDWIQ